MRFWANRFRGRTYEGCPCPGGSLFVLSRSAGYIQPHTHTRYIVLAAIFLFRLCLNFDAIILCNNIKEIVSKKMLDKIFKSLILRATKTKQIKIF